MSSGACTGEITFFFFYYYRIIFILWSIGACIYTTTIRRRQHIPSTVVNAAISALSGFRYVSCCTSLSICLLIRRIYTRFGPNIQTRGRMRVHKISLFVFFQKLAFRAPSCPRNCRQINDKTRSDSTTDVYN